MASLRPWLLLPCSVLLAHCRADFTSPPVTGTLVLSYLPGDSGLVPSNFTGAQYLARVRVTTPKGIPVQGVAVSWDGQAFPSPVEPLDSVTDDSGYSATLWTFRSNPGIQYIYAYLPGASGNPRAFRVQVYQRPPEPPPTGN
ncbi:MAG TPA: hypothetical protein VMG41_01410 [Gemmatimonadales bacterium]|nr:hypothetical protein [Gemmatimonadales bacterium]